MTELQSKLSKVIDKKIHEKFEKLKDNEHNIEKSLELFRNYNKENSKSLLENWNHTLIPVKVNKIV